MQHEDDHKQTWEAPKLILLGRGNPEEQVLLNDCFQDPDTGMWNLPSASGS